VALAHQDPGMATPTAPAAAAQHPA